jgi:hypothetical protein
MQVLKIDKWYKMTQTPPKRSISVGPHKGFIASQVSLYFLIQGDGGMIPYKYCKNSDFCDFGGIGKGPARNPY